MNARALEQGASFKRSITQTLLIKDLRLARVVVGPALGVLSSIALLVCGLPLVAPSLARLMGLPTGRDGSWFLVPLNVFAFCLVPAWTAVALSFGELSRKGEVLTATLPLEGATKWRSKFLVALLVYAVFALIAFATLEMVGAAMPLVAGVERGWVVAVALIGLCWGFGAAGFTRGIASGFGLAPALPFLAFLCLLVVANVVTPIFRDLIWASIGFDARFFPSDTRFDIDEVSNKANFWRHVESPLLLSILSSLFLCGVWSAWHARGWIAGQHAAARTPARGLLKLAVLVVLLGVFSSAIAAVTAQTRLGWNQSANQAIMRGFESVMAMDPDKLADESTKEVGLSGWSCNQILVAQRFAWSHLYVAPGGIADEVIDLPTSRFRGPHWDEQQGKAVALRVRMADPNERAALLAAFERIAADSTGHELGQRLAAAFKVESRGVEVSLVSLAAHAIADHHDACDVLFSMEVLAIRHGTMQGFPHGACECRVRAVNRLRGVRAMLASGAPDAAAWEGRLDVLTVDRALAVLSAPMTFVRDAESAALAAIPLSPSDPAHRAQLERRHAELFACLECDITTLIDESGMRLEPPTLAE